MTIAIVLESTDSNIVDSRAVEQATIAEKKPWGASKQEVLLFATLWYVMD